MIRTIACWILALLLVVAVAGHAVSARSGADTRLRVDEAHQLAIRFLTTWLVRANPNAALDMIPTSTLKTRFVLPEDCAGYIDDQDRGNVEATRSGVLKFLADFDSPCRSTSLGHALAPAQPSLWKLHKGQILRLDRRNSVILAYGWDGAPGDDLAAKDLVATYPTSALIIALAQIDHCDNDGRMKAPIYLILAQNDTGTSIVAFGMFCQ